MDIQTRPRISLIVLFSLLSALLTACALGFDFSLPNPDTNAFAHACRHYIVILLLWAFLSCFYYIVMTSSVRTHITLNWPVSLLLGAGYGVGEYFWNDYPFTSRGQELKLVVAILGCSILFWFFLQLMSWILERPWSFPGTLFSSARSLFNRRPFFVSFAFLAIMWIIPLLLHYPAGIYFDVNNELEQGFGLRPVNTGHPLAHIFLLTFFVKAGMLLGHANWGIFALEVIFALILACITSYGVHLLVQREAPWWSYVAILLFYGASPWIIGTLGDPTKDVHYSTFVFLFVILLWEMTGNPTQFFRNKRTVTLLILTVTFIILFRHNGLHIVLITLAITLVYLWFHSRPIMLRASIVSLCCISIPVLTNISLNAIVQPEEFRAGEALSLPLQQSARLIRDHPELITSEEEEVLRKVLPFDHVNELYDPYSIDRLKDTVRYDDAQEFTPGQEDEYLSVWFQQFFRAPLTYLAATWQQNLFLAYPKAAIHHYYINATNEWEDGTYIHQFFSDPESLREPKEAFNNYLDTLHTNPILGIFNSFALFTMSIPMLCALAFQPGRRHLFIPLLPLILSIFVVIAAPGLMNFPKYAYPAIMSIPFLWGVFAAELSKRSQSPDKTTS